MLKIMLLVNSRTKLRTELVGLEKKLNQERERLYIEEDKRKKMKTIWIMAVKSEKTKEF